MSVPGIVYVVDDDESFRTAITRLLKLVGFEVRAYASGEELLAEVRPETGGCVLADLRMPGLSGLELRATLRQAGVLLPVIVLTGDSDLTDSEKPWVDAETELVEKRSPRDFILSAVQRALARDAAGRSSRSSELLARRPQDAPPVALRPDDLGNSPAGRRTGGHLQTG